MVLNLSTCALHVAAYVQEVSRVLNILQELSMVLHLSMGRLHGATSVHRSSTLFYICPWEVFMALQLSVGGLHVA